MSNAHMFLKSAFPKSPLQNGLGRYICQLQRVTLKFCKNNGSSKGMRNFIENGLLDYAKENPSVVVYVKPRRHRTPVIVAEYLNGDRQWINCRNHSDEEITKWLQVLKTQNEDHTATRYRKMWHTDQPSIQGVWTPYTQKNPTLNLVQFPEESLAEPLDREETATERLIKLMQERRQQAETK